MKKLIMILLALAMVCSAAVAETGFTGKVDIDTNLVQFFHQELKNDTYVDNAVLPKEDYVYFMHNPNYDDVEFNVAYTDPEDRFGGKIGFDFGASLEKYFTVGDVYGWVKVTPYFRGKLGTYTDRVVEKIGGDKDLGVLLFGIENGDLAIKTSDSLGLGSKIIGFLPTGYIPLGPGGDLSVSAFFAPNEYYLAQKVTNNTDPNYPPSIIIPSYATYTFGGALKYDFPEWASLGLSYRTAHSKTVSGTDMGEIFHDFGTYCIVTLPMVEGLKIGLGYSGHLAYDDEDDDADEIRKPLQNAVHFDVGYKGIPRLALGLYNNISFYTLNKEDTLSYIAEVDRLNPNVFGDEVSLVLYNELSGSYDITERFTASLMARNYYATLTNMNGGKGQTYAKNTFVVEALAKYQISELVQGRAGLKFESNTYGTPISSQVLQNSNYAISVPVGLTVSW